MKSKKWYVIQSIRQEDDTWKNGWHQKYLLVMDKKKQKLKKMKGKYSNNDVEIRSRYKHARRGSLVGWAVQVKWRPSSQTKQKKNAPKLSTNGQVN